MHAVQWQVADVLSVLATVSRDTWSPDLIEEVDALYTQLEGLEDELSDLDPAEQQQVWQTSLAKLAPGYLGCL